METKAIAMIALLEADKAIELYKNALGAEVLELNHDEKTNYITHAEILVFNTHIMLHDIRFQANMRKIDVPAINKNLHPFSFYVYVPDADAAFTKAIEKGMQVEQPMSDGFWGHRFGMVSDTFGISWIFATPLANAK